MNDFKDIELQSIEMGRDLLLTITGGDAHIGAASTAYWNVDGSVRVQTSVVPGHKEHILTEGLAERTATALRRTVTVVMGIHYDGLTREEIHQISTITDNLLDDYLASCGKGSNDEQRRS